MALGLEMLSLVNNPLHPSVCPLSAILLGTCARDLESHVLNHFEGSASRSMHMRRSYK